MNAIIIDDEPDSVRLLALQIAKCCPKVNILATCTTPEEGLEALRAHQPDLVFLDIEMPRMNGFALLEQMDNCRFHVVFTTAYDRYAVKAFRFNALDYLLKPIDEKELAAAVGKAEAAVPIQGEQLAEVRKWMTSEQHKPDKIAISARDRFVLVSIRDIVYCESDKSYTMFYLKNGQKHLLSRPLGEVEEMFAGMPFFRIHKQYIVHVEEIVNYSRGEAATVLLSNGQHLPISRYRLEAFKALFL
jgi:two-component system, LytTR family, response regulator